MELIFECQCFLSWRIFGQQHLLRSERVLGQRHPRSHCMFGQYPKRLYRGFWGNIIENHGGFLGNILEDH